MGLRAITAFFFAPQSPRPLALVRIALGLVLLYDAAVRWPFAIELYSSEGMPLPPFPGTWLEPAALGASATVLLHSLLVFALCAAVVGWQTRVSLLVAIALDAHFGLLDGPGTFKKYSVIALHLLLLLSLSRCGAAWSVDALARRPEAGTPLAPAWPRRLMQILLASVYFGAAVTKLRLPEFATGELLEFSLLDDAWGGRGGGLWLATRPRLLVLASMLTLLIELLFPVLIWVARLRRPVLLAAIVFHLTLGWLMHLGIFSAVMLAGLLAFVEESDLRAMRSCIRGVLLPSWPRSRIRRNAGLEAPGFRRIRRRQITSRMGAAAKPWRSAFVYALAAALAAFGGWLVQRQMDWYGAFGDPVAHEMPVAPPAEAARMLAEQKPAYADYVHRLEIGSRVSLSSLRTFGERWRFRRGMSVHALVRLTQEHEPLDLEWVLIAPDGTEAARHEHHAEAAVTHATVAFHMPEDAPRGRYRIVLRVEGVAAAERDFVVDE